MEALTNWAHKSEKRDNERGSFGWKQGSWAEAAVTEEGGRHQGRMASPAGNDQGDGGEQ